MLAARRGSFQDKGVCPMDRMHAWLRGIGAAAVVACAALALAVSASGRAAAGTPIQIYGAWHCGNDACTWASVRDMTDFDYNNHWLVDRGDGRPSVNLVILSFVHP